MAWSFFAGGTVIAAAILANPLEGTIAYIPLGLTDIERIVAPGWLAAGSTRHNAIAIPFAIGDLEVP